MIAPFDDIGGIVDHHCLNFLFITKLMQMCYEYTLINLSYNHHPLTKWRPPLAQHINKGKLSVY